MTDDMLRAVAKNGGTVQVNFFSGFVDEAYWKASQAQRKDMEAAIKAFIAQRKAEGKPVTYADYDRLQREWMARIPRPPLKSLIDHIDHIAKVAGIDHVGLGSDFDGAMMPEGMEDCSKLPRLTEALLRKGFSESDIRKILGENTLRAMAEAERVARQMQPESK